MRIALISHSISKQGGISRYVAELAERFVKEHEVHLLTRVYNYEVPNLYVHNFPIIPKPLSFQVASNAIKNTLAVKYLNKKYNFDVVASNGAESLSQDILTAHSCHKAWVEQWKKEKGLPFDPFPVGHVVLAIEKHNYKKGNYKKIISASQGVKREIMKYYGVPAEDICVVTSGVDLNEFNPNNKKIFLKEIRNKYNISKDDIVLVFVAYEFKRKGLEYIIKSLPYIKSKNVKLLIVGKDNPKPYLNIAKKQDVDHNLIFAGPSSNVNQYHAASDIFVFPTAYEAFSLATLEAVASGLPILATKVNGTEELIKDGYNGFFIKRDPKNIAEKINLLIEDEKLRNAMGKNARKTAENYSWDKIAKRTLEVYEEVARR